MTIVVHVPHASTFIPEDVVEQFQISRAVVERGEVICISDFDGQLDVTEIAGANDRGGLKLRLDATMSSLSPI